MRRLSLSSYQHQLSTKSHLSTLLSFHLAKNTRIKMTKHTMETTTASKPGILSRLRSRPARQPASERAKISHEVSRNPITGTRTETTKKKTHPRGYGHHGHGGRGPLAAEQPTTSHRQRRKPGIGDKLSGAMLKAKGEATGKPGVKVRCRVIPAFQTLY